MGNLSAHLRDLEENGIVVGEETIKWALFCIAGDNLGSHSIGGFTKNFSTSQYICRYCEIRRNNFKSDPNACAPQQTPETYNSAVRHLQDGSGQDVKGVSDFRLPKSFHVYKPGLPPCLGHNLFEGVLSYDVALYLK